MMLHYIWKALFVDRYYNQANWELEEFERIESKPQIKNDYYIKYGVYI